MNLNNQVALVTGGAQGIGKAFAQYLLENQVKVMLSDMNQTVGETTKTELANKYGKTMVSFIVCDVTNDAQFEEAIKKTIRQFGSLDILINNAGIFCELEPNWKKMINVNFVALVKGTNFAMKYMGKHLGGKGGTVVNIASITTFEPLECGPIYSATKSAVNQYSRSIGATSNYNRTGVRVISINPGITDTDIIKNLNERVINEHVASGQKFIETKQSPSNMGKELIRILEIAETGTMWVIESSLPAKKIDLIVEKTDIMA